MIVADTSAWIDFLRGIESRVSRQLEELIEAEEDLAVTEIVVMELLGGATTGRADLRTNLLAYPILPLQGLQDYEEAALIFHRCRRAGETLRRGYVDCLIAVPALRAGAEVLHNDADFEVIARHTDLKLVV